jgi:triacylglycerol esterase/lipase EstA (alpha/beta hydrolase family)
MVREDAELKAKYEVGLFEYTTGVFGSGPAFAVVAESVKTEIESRYAAFGDIAIIAHSQGGLIARQYIADRINAGERLPVRRLLTFATPHLGSLLATLGKWLPGTSKQTKAVAQDSDFIIGLAKAWGRAKAG